MRYVDFNDESLPLGKRKVAYVKWAVSKGTALIVAQRQANKKFGYSETSSIHKECSHCRERRKLWDNHTCEHCLIKYQLVSPNLDKHYEELRAKEQTNE